MTTQTERLDRRVMELKKAAKIGKTMADKRIAKRYKASWVATEMGISPSMICILEKGLRVWSPELKQRYLKAIGEL